MIRQILNLDFSRETTVCPKHRTMYGIGWKPPTICSYPEHQKTKKASNTRAITLPAILEIRKLFSSSAKIVFVPLGSKWCDTCRKKTHYNLCQKNSAVIKTLTFCNCSACCSIHDTLGNLQNHLSETLAKKQKNDLENGNADDEDFREEGSEQHSFNESMIEINTKWTPRKYQLRTDLNAVSVKTKEKLVRKSNQAVKSILEIIAPGQSETLREACLEETELTSDSSLYILKIM